jgi:magnesium transporter
MEKERITYADDDTESVGFLIRLRTPSLIFGLLLGLGLSFVTSRFEEVISANIAVAFFIPLIVYLAAAIGAQTQSIYIRDLKTGKAKFKDYLFKETAIGLLLGVLFGVLVTLIVFIWFKTIPLSLAVGASLFGAVAVAPLVALVVTELLQIEHTDPAVGAGPLATVIQDTISVLIYGLIATAILL